SARQRLRSETEPQFMSSPAVTGLLRVDGGLSTETVTATNPPVPRVVSGIPLAYRLRTLLGTPLRNRVARSRQRFLKAAAADCRGIQETVLQDLLKLNSGSDFAKDFGLRPGLSPQQFRSQVPISDYELYRPYVDRMLHGETRALLGRRNRLLMFAMTSGTTSSSKYIPVTSRFLSDYRAGWQMWGIELYRTVPGLPHLNVVQIASSHRRSLTAAGTPCGNISGLVASMQSPVVRSLYTIPAAVADVSDADLKRRLILSLAFGDPHVGMFVTANPSTLLQLFESVENDPEQLLQDLHDGLSDLVTIPKAAGRRLRAAVRPKIQRARQLQQLLRSTVRLTPRDVWPNLQVLACWTGGSASAYTSRLREICEGITICDHGLHASEGRMTMPLAAETSSGLLEIGTHYFEFLPVAEAESANPDVLNAWELEPGSEYYILLTTSSGFCRYNIRDVVRCTGFHGDAPLLEFLHKGAHISSITGEKISESQVVEAVRAAQVGAGLWTAQFTMTPEWLDQPGYTLYVDLRRQAESTQLERFASLVEQQLCDRNEEYREKRQTGRLSAIRMQPLPESAWQTLQQTRLNKTGGTLEQYKHPCLMPDPEFRRIFLQACGLTHAPTRNTHL
ncbi:MAG TPA: auxin-responsive protein, partial [Planctomycetaceae bacterium]|nr:auxin-responsive protein [Planctomycetaceae bacterium]